MQGSKISDKPQKLEDLTFCTGKQNFFAKNPYFYDKNQIFMYLIGRSNKNKIFPITFFLLRHKKLPPLEILNSTSPKFYIKDKQNNKDNQSA